MMIAVKNGGVGRSRDVILFLSDNAQAAVLWQSLFAQRGCLVLWHADARFALDSLSGFSPSLVVLNLFLDTDEQILLCRRTRRAFSGPILMMLPQADSQQIIDLYEAGADECLVEPEGAAFLPVKAVAWMQRYEWIEADRARIHGLM
jgi:DNA-binding response OmpR family regulator